MFGLLCYCCRSFCFVVFVGAWFVVLLLLTFGLLCFNLLFLFGLLYCWAFVHCCVAVLFLLSCSTVFVCFRFPWLCYCCCCCCWLLVCCLVAVIDVLFVQCVSVIASVYGLSCYGCRLACRVVLGGFGVLLSSLLLLKFGLLCYRWY